MGQNNRAWVRDHSDDSSLYWVYMHDYLGGTMEFDVDLSEVDCACASGLYLVEAHGENCYNKAKDGTVDPQCARVELMEANKHGFTAASYPCEGGQCASESKTQVNAHSGEYGPGTQYIINTEEPFKVTTKFYAPEGATEHSWGDLKMIETTLTQNSRQLVMIQDDPEVLWGISYKLYASMATVMSNFDAGMDNNISEGQCTTGCGDYKSKFMNLRWTRHDSIWNDGNDGEGEGDDDEFEPEPEPAELVIGEITESIDECDDEFCSACHYSWYSDSVEDVFPTCTDYTHYKYSNVCKGRGKRFSKELCGEEDLCFKSYPSDDPKKWRSDDFACRPLPGRHMDGDFKYAKRECKSNRGLCGLGCDEGETCHNSWPIDDPAKWKSADAMCRCKGQ